jgi:hypothetical protein
METASIYFTRRARQERTTAADAGSAEARAAHLELAFRLVRVATEAAEAVDQGQLRRDHTNDVKRALADAFPSQPAADFKRLLDAVDQAEFHPL